MLDVCLAGMYRLGFVVCRFVECGVDQDLNSTARKGRIWTCETSWLSTVFVNVVWTLMMSTVCTVRKVMFVPLLPNTLVGVHGPI